MADTTYRLVVDLSTRGSLSSQIEKVGARAAKVDDIFKKIGSGASLAMGKVGDVITSTVEKTAALAVSMTKLGAIGAGGALAYGVAHLNQELEKTQISLASILNAQGMTASMPEALDRASGIIKEMRKDAAQLPGEFEDLLSFFRLGATPGIQAGASVEQLEKMSANAMAAAAAVGVPMDQAAREFAQLLQGRAGAHNVFGAMLGFTGDDAHKFNQLSGDKRLKELEKALAKYRDSISVFGTSYDALTSALKENAKQALQKMTEPLFGRVKDALRDANRWFDEHEDKVRFFTNNTGRRLAEAFDVGRAKIEHWFPLIARFGEEMGDRIERAWGRAEPIVGRLGARVEALLKDPDAVVDKLGTIAALYGVAKVAPGVGSAASSLAGAAGVGGLAAGGIAAGVIALFAADVLAVTRVITDSSSSMHADSVARWHHMKQSFSSAFDHLENAWSRLEPAAMRIADLYGNFVVSQLDRAATAVETLAGALDTLTSKASAAAGRAGERLETFEQTTDLGGFWKWLTVGKELSPDDPATFDRSATYTPFVKAMNEFGELVNGQKTKTGAGHGGGGTHIQKVEIVVSSNQDPSRIARLTVDRLMQMTRPGSSPLVRQYSGAGG